MTHRLRGHQRCWHPSGQSIDSGLVGSCGGLWWVAGECVGVSNFFLFRQGPTPKSHGVLHNFDEFRPKTYSPIQCLNEVSVQTMRVLGWNLSVLPKSAVLPRVFQPAGCFFSRWCMARGVVCSHYAPCRTPRWCTARGIMPAHYAPCYAVHKHLPHTKTFTIDRRLLGSRPCYQQQLYSNSYLSGPKKCNSDSIFT